MKKILFLIICFFICQTVFAQNKAWSSLLSKDFQVKLDLKNKTLDQVASWYSTKSGLTIIADPKFKNKISISSPKPISMSQSFEMFEAALNLNSYSLVKENKFLIIKPKDIIKKADIIEKNNIEDSEIKIYKLKNNNADSISKIINELFNFNKLP